MPSQSYIEYLLASGRTEEAIECLLVVTLGTGWYGAVIEQSLQYQELRWQERGSLRTDATLASWRTRIEEALLALTELACPASDADASPPSQVPAQNRTPRGVRTRVKQPSLGNVLIRLRGISF